MRPMLRKFFCLLSTICLVGLTSAQETSPTPEQIAELRVRLSINDDKLLQAMFELEEHEAAIGQLIPALTKLVVVGNDATLRAALRCLGTVGDKAEPATGVIIARLDHHDYILRSELMRVLKGIGPEAIPALQKALVSPSARVRASVLSVLNELTVVDVGMLEPLENDLDVRVRICAAQSWKKHGKPGVERILAMLKDPEPVVAVGAADALRFHFADTALAVPALIESLSRKDVGGMSAMALQSYGVESQSAIPALIRSFPLGYPDDSMWYEDIVEVSIEHIGPARIEDLDLLRQLLVDANPAVRTLAANAIGQLGPAAVAAHEDLERMIPVSLREAAELATRAEAIDNEDEREDFLRSNPSYRSAATALCAANWRVTRKTEQFVESITLFANQFGDSIYFDTNPPFADFNEDDVQYLIQMLDSPNEYVRATALIGMSSLPGQLISLELFEKFRRQKDNDSEYVYVQTACNLESKLGPQVLPWLIEDMENGYLKPTDFAVIAGKLKIRDARSDRILMEGLDSNDSWLPASSLRALASSAVDAEQAACLLVAAARKNTELRRSALESFWKLPGPTDLVVPFAVECLGDADYWTRRRAITVLARIGPEAKSALRALTQVSTRQFAESDRNLDEQTELRVVIAVASITGDRSEFQRRFDQAIADGTDAGLRTRYCFCEILRELGPRAYEHFDSIVRLLEIEEKNRGNVYNCIDDGLRVLGVIGSPRAIELLGKYTHDRDWVIRNQAIQLLRAIENGSDLPTDDDY